MADLKLKSAVHSYSELSCWVRCHLQTTIVEVGIDNASASALGLCQCLELTPGHSGLHELGSQHVSPYTLPVYEMRLNGLFVRKSHLGRKVDLLSLADSLMNRRLNSLNV